MDSVFLLWHTHAVTPEREDDKLLGIYSTYANALAAQARVANKPGFLDHPDGFEVSEYKIDRDSWTEGFVTVD